MITIRLQAIDCLDLGDGECFELSGEVNNSPMASYEVAYSKEG